MANNTCSCRKSKDDENNNGSCSGFSASDASVLRRSARKTLSISRIFSIPLSTRKSERLLKGTAPTLAVRRKFERLVQPKMSIPLRRSERVNKYSHLIHLDSKSSGSSFSKHKPEKDKDANKEDCHEETSRMLPSSEDKAKEIGTYSRLSGQERGEKLTPSKRKGKMMEKLSDVSAGVVNEDNCTQLADAALRQCECKVGNIIGTCKTCSKRIRLNHDPIVYYNIKESINPSTTEDSNVEKLSTLAIPDPQRGNEENGGLIFNSNDSIGQLRDKLSKDIAYGCKSDSFRFVEYWVPVQISQVQLEWYCAALVSNTSVLRSFSKNDRVGALQDLLISTRKCCNHPYVVDPSLQTLLTGGLQKAEYLDIGIKASGKLQALDSMLTELKKNGSRVLILFQSIGGSARDSIGDILDDFLHQRFGSDAYERVDKGVVLSKKLTALNLFNKKDSGRFIFLLEACACVPSIKLSSIDIVIIFDSDWNPMSDIRSLQRITLDSQCEQIKIFRLYSCFTVEEKALILAKEDKALDSNLQNISWKISHTLLMWGASCLLDNLRLFHDGRSSSSCSNFSFENCEQLLEEALHEFSSILLQDNGDNDTCNYSIILKVQLNQGTYCTSFDLLGERKLGSPDEGLPHMFWTKLLRGKVFQWKYSCVSSQRSRKRAQHFGGSVNTLNSVSEEIARKRKKVINSVVDELPSNFQCGKSSSGKNEGKSGDLVGIISQFFPCSTASIGYPLHVNHTVYSIDLSQGNKAEYEKIRKLCDEQKSLHLLLKPEIAKLCEILLLPDNVKTVVDNFLEYIMNNHHINRESESILQAFQISLCWTAASLLKHKIDHRGSLMLARQHLKFDCGKEEADYMYSILRCLKKTFLYRAGNFNATSSPKVSELPNKVYLCTGVAPEIELAVKDIAKSIKDIQKKCQKKLRKLLLMQHEERNKLNAVNEEKKAVLREKYKTESTVIRYCFPNDVMRLEKLKILDKEYAKRIEELECQHGVRIKDLEAEQLAARQKFQCREAIWIEKVKRWAEEELKIILSKEFRSALKYSKTSDQDQPPDGSKNVGLVSDHIDEGPITASYGGPVSSNDGHTKAENVCENQGNIISMRSYSKEHNSDGATNMAYEGQSTEDIAMLAVPSSEGEICDGKTSIFSTQEVAVEVHNTSNLNDDQDKVLSSTKGEICGTILSKPGFGFSLEVKANGSSDGMNDSLNSQLSQDPMPSANDVFMLNCENAGQIHEANESSVLNKFVTLNSPPCEDRTVDVATGIVLERDVTVGTIGTVFLTDCPKNDIPPKPPSSVEQRSDGGALNVLDRELSPRPFETDSPGHGSDIISVSNSLSSEHQTGGQIPIKVLESRHEVAQCHNDREQQTDPILLDKITSSDQQEGFFKTMKENSLSQEISVLFPEVIVNEAPLMKPFMQMQQSPTSKSRSSNLDMVGEMQNPSQQVERATSPVGAASSLEQVHVLHSAESPLSNQDPAEEVQNSSQEVELLYNPVDAVLYNQSNHESLVMEPVMQLQQLPTSSPPSSNQDIVGEMQNTFHQVERATSPVGAVSSLEKVELLHLAESLLSNQDTAEEVQNSSQEVELPNPVDVVLGNQSNHESLVMEPLMQVKQLPTSSLPSSNQDIVGEMQNPSEQLEGVTSPVGVVSSIRLHHESQVMDNLRLVQELQSTEHPSSNQNTVEELQNSFQQAESVSSTVDDTPLTRTNREILVREPPEHVQVSVGLPPSSSHLSNLPLTPGIEHQHINEDTISSHVSQPLAEVTNQAVMHRDSLMPVACGTYWSNTTNRSATSEINNHRIQIATQSASRMPPPYLDPIQIEMEKICKEIDQAGKDHENVKLQLKSACEKEMEEVLRKYNVKFQEIEVERQQKKKNLDTNINLALVTMKLAGAARTKYWGPKLIDAFGKRKDANFTQQLVQRSGQQSAIRPSLVVGPSLCRPVANLQTGHIMTSSQPVVLPIQSTYNTRGNFSGRPPRANTIPSSSGYLLADGNTHASALCPQTHRSLTSIPTSLPTLLPRMSSRLASSNIPATSLSFSHHPPLSTPPIYQLDPHNRRHWPAIAAGFPFVNLSGVNNHIDVANQFGFNLPNSLPHI